MKGSTSQFYRGTTISPRFLTDMLYSDGERFFTWNVYTGRWYLSEHECSIRRTNDLFKYGRVRVRVRAKSERIDGKEG